jgi:hypothetical protein
MLDVTKNVFSEICKIVVGSSFPPVGESGTSNGQMLPADYVSKRQNCKHHACVLCRADLFVTWLDIISSLQNTVYLRGYKKPVMKNNICQQHIRSRDVCQYPITGLNCKLKSAQLLSKYHVSAERVCLQEILCCTWTCLSTRACAAPVSVCLQEILCCTWTCMLSLGYYLSSWCTCKCAFMLQLDVSVYKSLCCTWRCLICGGFFGLFRFVAKHSVVSLHVHNTKNQPKNYLFNP